MLPTVTIMEEDIKQRMDSLLNTPISDKIYIGAWGIVNAGKSTLLNMLTKNIKHEYFKTADRRETTENKSFETEEFCFLDMPGLDADDEDDNEAFLGLIKVDFLLFVHKPPGELDSKEVNLLTKLKLSAFNTQERLIIVLTNLENGRDGSIEQIEDKIKVQCQDILGHSVPIFKVANNTYKKGFLENKTGLQEKSGIPELEAYIQKLPLVKAEITLERRLKRKNAMQTYLDELSQLKVEKEGQLKRSQEPLLNAFIKFDSLMAQLIKQYKQYSSSFNKVVSKAEAKGISLYETKYQSFLSRSK